MKIVCRKSSGMPNTSVVDFVHQLCDKHTPFSPSVWIYSAVFLVALFVVNFCTAVLDITHRVTACKLDTLSDFECL